MAQIHARRPAYTPPYQPSPRIAHSAVSLGSGVIVWNGRVADFLKIKGKPQNPSVVEVLDGLLEEWQQKTTYGAAPLPMYWGACAALGNSIYTCGYDGTTVCNSIHHLDPYSYKWKGVQPSNPADSPMPKFGCVMIAIDDDKLAVIGGYGKPTNPACLAGSNLHQENCGPWWMGMDEWDAHILDDRK